MLRTLLLSLGLCAVTSLGHATEIRPVESWSDYRQQRIADGDSPEQADSEIAEMLTGLRSMDRAAGEDRIGLTAPPFRFDAWLNSAPLQLDQLRGRVVLVRWWTDTCPFCASSAPALRALHQEYAELGTP